MKCIPLAKNAQTNTNRMAALAAGITTGNFHRMKPHAPIAVRQVVPLTGTQPGMVLSCTGKCSVSPNTRRIHTPWHVPQTVMNTTIPLDRGGNNRNTRLSNLCIASVTPQGKK